jgi:ferritin-like metal-binding protein YciE
MRLKSMEALLLHELKDLYSAESQLIRALPKMAKAAKSPKLRKAIEEHLEVTKQQKERLDQIFDLMEGSSRGPKCKAMEGLIEEGEELMEEEGEDNVKDAALIAAAQRVEHYEIAGYGAARTFAELLERKDVAKLLQQTLDEEKETDELLNKIAHSEVNPAAMKG